MNIHLNLFVVSLCIQLLMPDILCADPLANQVSSNTNNKIQFKLETARKKITVPVDTSVLEKGYYYTYNGKHFNLHRINDRILIGYKNVKQSTIPQFKQKQLFQTADVRKIKIAGSSLEVMTFKKSDKQNKNSHEFIKAVKNEIGNDPSLSFTSPVYYDPQSGKEVIFTNKIAVMVEDEYDIALQSRIGSLLDAQFEKVLMPQVFLFTCQNMQTSDALERCMSIEHEPGVLWAQPEMITTIKKCYIPNDPLFSKQWHLVNPGTNGSKLGADMKIDTAWDIQQMADPNIKIAVLDDGVDFTHPDLAVDSGYDFCGNDNDPSPNSSEDNHGTSVSGVAAAIGNNGIGCAGVAAGAKIIPIKILDKIIGLSDFQIAEAITWAYQHGAAVLNNSWGQNIGVPDNSLGTAIKNASTLGRGGKGCLVFCSSGNDASTFTELTISFVTDNECIIAFVYQKDATGSSGDDKVYVDNVYLYDSENDSVNYFESFSSAPLPTGWSTRGGINGSTATVGSVPVWSRSTSVYQQGFDGGQSSMGSGAIANNQWTELRMPLRTYKAGELMAFNFRTSCDLNDSLRIRIYAANGTSLINDFTISSGIYDPAATTIAYPAALDSAIAVGSSNDLDYRSDYSQYNVSGTGKTVDFVAPSGGGYFGITTTDRTGTNGYDNTSDYFSEFSGTSSACPAASGLAALILSRNPNLSRNKVLEVMRSTCDQIGGVTYDNNGKHKEYGYGRLNAQQCLENLPPVITGQNPIAVMRNTSKTLSPDDLIIFDTETPYGPFTLTVFGGNNYTFSGTTITPSIGFVGTLTIPVSVSDGTYNSDRFNLSVNVLATNEPPVINGQQPITILEDGKVLILASDLTITDLDNPTGPFIITVNSGINYTIVNDSVVPDADFNGILTVPVTASDGLSSSDPFNVSITVTAVNDAPSFIIGPTISVPEDNGPYTSVNWATIVSTGASNESQTLGFIINSVTNPSFFANGPSLSNTGTLTFTPASNAAGTSIVTITLKDDGGTANGGNDVSAPHQFTITINSINDPPTFTKGADITIAEDAGAQTITSWAKDISAGGPDESGQNINFVLSNNNNTLFTSQPHLSETDGTLTFTAAANRFGTVLVTARLYDNGGGNDSNVQTFTITITNVNDIPTFTAGNSQTVLEDAGPQTVISWASDISAGPYEPDNLQFVCTASNTGLFSTQPAINNNGDLTYTTALNANGIATIQVHLNDGIDNSTFKSFTISITSVNDAPTFVPGSDIFLSGNPGAYSAIWATGLNAGAPDESTQGLSFTLSLTNLALFANLPILSSSGTLLFTPASGVYGSSTITAYLHDNGGTANGGSNVSAPHVFTITISPINAPPSFTKGSDVTVAEDAGAQTVTSWATNINPGSPDETSQILHFVLINNNNSLFSVQPHMEENGTLIFTPAPNMFGTTQVVARLYDNGGGNDSSAAQTFSITVSNINDPPSFTAGSAQTVNEDAGLKVISSWASAISSGPNETDPLHFTITVIHPELFSVQPAVNQSGDLSFTPAPNISGASDVSVRLFDQYDSSALVTISITILPVNDPPTFTPGNTVSVLEDAPAQTLTSWATFTSGPIDEASQNITGISLSISDTTLFSIKPSLTISGTLTFTPAPNRSGTASVTVSLTDNGGTANGGVATMTSSPFSITIIPVNDMPSFTPGSSNITVSEDAGAQSFDWATNITAGINESEQTLQFSIKTSNSALFSTLPSIDAVGKLTFTPALNANGSSEVNVRLKDLSGTDNGGIDSSAEAVLTISVTPVNDIPSISISGNFDLTPNIESSITITATDVEPGIPGIQIQNIPSFATITNPGTGTAIIQCHPAATDMGSYQIIITADDNELHKDTSITLNVTAPAPGAIFISGVSSNAVTRYHTSSGWIGTPLLTGPGLIATLKSGTYLLAISDDGMQTRYVYGSVSAQQIDTIIIKKSSPFPVSFSSSNALQAVSGEITVGGLVSAVMDDIDNDNLIDIAYTGSDGVIRYYKGNGVTFADPVELYKGFTGRNTLRCIDWNDDGLNDLLMVNMNGLVWLCRGKAGGGFTKDTTIFTTDPGCTGVEFVADPSGKAMYLGFSNGTLQYATISGDGTLTTTSVRNKNGQLTNVGNDADVTVIDLTGDGKNELLVGNSVGNVQIFTMKTADTVQTSTVASIGGMPFGQNGRVFVSSTYGIDTLLPAIVYSDVNGKIYRSRSALRGDITGDGTVDILDLQQLGIYWGKRSTDATWLGATNLTATPVSSGSQVINVLDLQMLGNCWGLKK